MTRLLAIEGVLAPDVNFHDNFVGAATGPTALYWAVHFGNEELVRLLLDKGADPNLKDEKGRTPLFYASSPGHVVCATAGLQLQRGPSASGPVAVEKNSLVSSEFGRLV